MNNRPILVHEHQKIRVNHNYPELGGGERKFEQRHFDGLSKYLTQTEVPFYSLGYQTIYFKQYVGTIQVFDLVIEVLPKTDKHDLSKAEWQDVLLDMLWVSRQVETKTSTRAGISVRHQSVLEAYFSLFLEETERLMHQGLIKKYRSHKSNQSALKGKLLVHEHLTKNMIHAERFYVSHPIYDRDNVYNAILKTALILIGNTPFLHLSQKAKELLAFFPNCQKVRVGEQLFERLTYDRKTQGYQDAIQLARIVLLNYHPDIKGGNLNILAIMFDMNRLWETYIIWSLRLASVSKGIRVHAQNRRKFWKPGKGRSRILKPDIFIESQQFGNIILDTKWKFHSSVSLQDLRQVFAYLHYFESSRGYLLYPDRVPEIVSKKGGNFISTNESAGQLELSCELIFADLIVNKKLNLEIGSSIIKAIGFHY